MIHLQPIKERLTYIMRILKLSLMLFIACTTMTAQAESSAGKYCKAAVFKYDCQPGAIAQVLTVAPTGGGVMSGMAAKKDGTRFPT